MRARFAVILIQTALIVVAAEGAARFAERLHPGTDSLTFDYAPYRMLRMSKAPWPLNREGFRAREFHSYRGSFLIEFLGGSVCLGVGTDPGKTIPERLEIALRQAGLADVAVVNLCQGGATSAQELAIFLEYGLPRHPDVVLSFDGANDLMHPRPLGEDDAPNLPYRNSEMKALFEGHHGLLAHLALVRVASRLAKRAPPTPVPTGRAEPDVSAQAILDSYEYVIGITSLLATHEGAYYAVLFQPTLHFRKTWNEAETAMWRQRRPHDSLAASAQARKLYESATPQLMRWAGANGVPVLNLTDAFDGIQEQVYSDSVHFAGETGYRLLFHELEQKGLLDVITKRYRKWEAAKTSASMRKRGADGIIASVAAANESR